MSLFGTEESRTTEKGAGAFLFEQTLAAHRGQIGIEALASLLGGREVDVGRDLRAMADEYKIAVWKNGRKNKGWAGLVLERYLGLPQNSRQEPDFGDWDLKLIALNYARDGTLRVKESMAITMLEPTEVLANNFEDSHLYDKLRRLIAVGRIHESAEEKRSILHSAAEFDLDVPKIRAQVAADYETIRAQIRTAGIDSVTGSLGKLVQARTKGAGHGSTSRTRR